MITGEIFVVIGSAPSQLFYEARSFQGIRQGYIFTQELSGLGYYRERAPRRYWNDTVAAKSIHGHWPSNWLPFYLSAKRKVSPQRL